MTDYELNTNDQTVAKIHAALRITFNASRSSTPSLDQLTKDFAKAYEAVHAAVALGTPHADYGTPSPSRPIGDGRSEMGPRV